MLEQYKSKPITKPLHTKVLWALRINIVLSGKKILIVGGSSGIGLALAIELVNLGGTVIIGSRSKNKLKEAKTIVPKISSVVQVDASDQNSVRTLFGEVGNIDHLVSTIKPKHLACEFSESDISDVRTAFESKFWGQYYLTHIGLKHVSMSGSIILTSGIASLKSYKGFSGTAAINGAVDSFVKSLASEISPIRINSVSPGFIANKEYDQERYNYVKTLGANIPLQRLGDAKEVVSAYVYLLQNTYATGTTLVVDGGENGA